METDPSRCLRCGRNGATMHMTFIKDGVSSTADLCPGCADALCLPGQDMPETLAVLDLIRSRRPPD